MQSDHLDIVAESGSGGAALSSDIRPRRPSTDDMSRTATASVTSGYVQQLIGCVLGGLLAVALLVAAALLLCRQGCRGRGRRAAVAKAAVAGARSTSTLGLFGRRRRRSMTLTSRQEDSATLTSTGKTTSNGLSSFSNCSLSATGYSAANDDDYDVTTLARCFRLPLDVIQTRQLPRPPQPSTLLPQQPPIRTDHTTSPYAAIGNGHVHYSATSAMPPTLLSVGRRPYAAAGVDALPAFYDRRDLLSPGTSPYSYRTVLAPPPEDVRPSTPPAEVPRSKLQFVHTLGHGLFGDVHLCELIRDGPTQDDVIATAKLLGDSAAPVARSTCSVAVRLFSADMAVTAREVYRRQTSVMSRLKHVNVVTLLGVCSLDEPLGAVLEYACCGDLASYLRHSCTAAAASTVIGVLPGTELRTNLSYGCLIFMATQIASAMKYIESLGVVHGSLSAASCVVMEHGFTVKLSDFGAAVDVYTAALSCTDPARWALVELPARWMAWESVVKAEFTSKSDVWSFAVTLWEILTLARCRPFDSLTDEEVVVNCRRHAAVSGGCPPAGSLTAAAVLDQPGTCPREIYDLMLECWRATATQRPSFREIHMFLRRKNSGYSPDDEPIVCRQTISDV